MNHARPRSFASSTPSENNGRGSERPKKRSRLDENAPNVGVQTTASSIRVSSNEMPPPPTTYSRDEGGKVSLPPTPDERMSLEPSPRTERVFKAFKKPSQSFDNTRSNRGSGLLSNSQQLTGSLDGKPPADKAIHTYIYQREEYDEGMYVYNRALQIDATASDSMRSAALLYNTGLNHVCQGKYQEARRWFELALVRITLDTRNPAAAISIVSIHHNLGHCLYRLGKSEEAMIQFRKALAIVRDRKLSDEHAAGCLNCIAVLLFHKDLSDSKKVLNLLEHALSIFQKVKGAKSVEAATVLNNIGRVHYVEGKYEEALTKYTEALELRRLLLGNTSIDCAATLCNKGQTHHQRGELDDAMECYEHFLKLAPGRLGSNHRDIAIIYKCMAEIYHERGDLENARSMYEKSLQSGRGVMGNYSNEAAATMNKLGNLYYELQDFDTSLRYYTEGLKVERSVLEESHPHILVTLMNIAQIHRGRGNFSEALEKYIEIHALQVKSGGVNTLEVANTLSNMGLMQYQLKQYSAAFDFYQEALRIQRDSFGEEDNLDIASTLNSIGLVLFNQNIYGLARGCFNDSLRIRKKLLGADHRDVAILWYNIATVFLETGDDDRAIQLYKETLRVERVALGEKHNDVILTLQHLGLVHQQRGELDLALEYFEEALEIERTKQSNSLIAIAKLLNLVGNIHLQQARVAPMMECYSEASRIYRDQHSDTLVIAGYNFYGLSKLHPPSAGMA